MKKNKSTRTDFYKLLSLVLLASILLVASIKFIPQIKDKPIDYQGIQIEERNLNSINQLFSENKFTRGIVCDIDQNKCISIYR